MEKTIIMYTPLTWECGACEMVKNTQHDLMEYIEVKTINDTEAENLRILAYPTFVQSFKEQGEVRATGFANIELLKQKGFKFREKSDS